MMMFVVLTGCASYADFRSNNRANLTKVSKGMAKAEVIQIMGSDSVKEGRMDTFTNPYKSEIIICNGGECEVYYYYTEQKGNKDWETSVTPVVFKDGKVIGIGWRFLDPSNKTITIKNR